MGLAKDMELLAGLADEKAMFDKPVDLPPQELVELMRRWPYGTAVSVPDDGMVGTVVGWYRTREDKPGLGIQQHGTKIVHVYRESRVGRGGKG